MRKFTLAVTAGLSLAVAGCGDSPIVTAENSATTDALSGALTPGGLQTLALGVLAQDRAIYAQGSQSAYLILSEIYARDAYRIDPNEPRYVTETLGGQPDAGSFAGGNSGWTPAFTTIRAAQSLLSALPSADPNAVTPAQRNITAGLVQTIKALNYYRVLELRDTVGVPIQAEDPTVVNPISCKKDVLEYIVAVLDSGLTSLNAAGAGATLPFTPPTGFTAFGRNYRTAANLILLNRGIRGKVDVYRGLQHTNPVAGAFTTAIANLTTALGGAAAGAVPQASFGNGAYITFVAGGTENTPNPISDARIGANPKLATSLQAGDTRSSKIITRSALTGNGLTTTINYVGASTANTANLTMPIAILRDEELVLLRAQAYFESGNFASGAADLNSVRTKYGLAAIATPADIATARTALLYEKRYSLLFEGPQRLVDLRAYSLLRAGVTPAELPNDPFNTAFPIPKGEADARGGNIAVVCK